MDQVSIGAGIQAGDDVAGLDRGGRHVDHREQGGRGVRAQYADDVEATHVGQVDVENQCLDGDTVDQLQALAAGTGFEHFIAMTLKASAQGIARGDVVVDDQQAQVTFHRQAPWRWPAG
ncbi:hypothetical protein D3C73_402020 [compost metagenome]